ncbi:MAG TPA: hypothetical protein VFB12_18825 [Ktedonobacteraceae bacterium]|nr:hypothetical protein [Ktedonobacteraceae bacterium]
MTVHHLSLLVRGFLLAALLLFLLKVMLTLFADTVVLTLAGASIYLILFVLALLLYGWFILFRMQATTQAERMALRLGSLFGLLCGVLWVIELFAANVLSPQIGWFRLVLYYGSTWSALVLPWVASLLTVWRSRQIVSGLDAGLLCGMCGGLAIFLASFVLSGLFLSAGQPDPQTIHEFERSGLSDIRTYLDSDYLAAMIAHLWIGLITGLILGALGGIIGKVIPLPDEMNFDQNSFKA